MKVWKYPLQLVDGPQIVPMPEGAKVLTVGPTPHQYGLGFVPAIWALVKEVDEQRARTPMTDRRFVVHGTGHEITEGATYLGSSHDSTFVWHVFEVGQ